MLDPIRRDRDIAFELASHEAASTWYPGDPRAIAQNVAMVDQPLIFVPSWIQSTSGLLVPGNVARLPAPPVFRGLPKELRPPARPVALAGAPPSSLDYVCVYVDEATIGSKPTTLTALREYLAKLPFEPAMNGIAQVAGKAFGLRGNRAEQLKLARDIYSEQIYVRIERFFAEDEHAELFSEQQVAVLARLVIEEAQDGVLAAGMSEAQRGLLTVAIFAAGSILEETATRAAEEMRDATDWLAFFLQNGAYNRKPAPLGEFVRARQLFGVIAREPQMRDERCSLDEWMGEDYQFTIEEQFALGFALAAMSHAWDTDASAGMRSGIRAEDFDDLLSRLGMAERRADALRLISADRATFAAEFAAAGTDPAHIAWEARPFMRRPFLRLSNDDILLISPRGMKAWLSDGFHYRLLDSAQSRSAADRKLSRRYTAYSGELLEQHMLRLARSSYGNRPLGGGRVYGEQPYGKDDAKTSDIAIDLGLDLVLIEISASRLRADRLIMGTPEEFAEDLDRLLMAKIKQLDGCIAALIAGVATIPAAELEVDLSRVQRIWPVVLSAGTISQSEMLWEYVRRQSKGMLAQAKVQPVTLLDPQDFEQLMGLVEGGRDLSTILAGKTTEPYRDLELAVYLNDAPGAPRERPRPAAIEALWQDTVKEANAMLALAGEPQTD